MGRWGDKVAQVSLPCYPFTLSPFLPFTLSPFRLGLIILAVRGTEDKTNRCADEREMGAKLIAQIALIGKVNQLDIIDKNDKGGRAD